jgi:hypothetical protein
MKLHHLLEEQVALRATMLKLQQQVIDEVDEDATFKFHNYANLHGEGPACTMIVTLHKYAAENADGEYSPAKHPTVWLQIYENWGEARIKQAYEYFKAQVKAANPKLKSNKVGHLNTLIYAAFQHKVVGDKDSGSKTKPTGFWAYKTEADLKSQRGEGSQVRSKLAAHIDVHTAEGSHGYMITYPDKTTRRRNVSTDLSR